MGRKLLIVIAVESCLLITFIVYSLIQRTEVNEARLETQKVRQELEIVKQQAFLQKEEAERQMMRATEFERAMSEQANAD